MVVLGVFGPVKTIETLGFSPRYVDGGWGVFVLWLGVGGGISTLLGWGRWLATGGGFVVYTVGAYHAGGLMGLVTAAKATYGYLDYINVLPGRGLGLVVAGGALMVYSGHEEDRFAWVLVSALTLAPVGFLAWVIGVLQWGAGLAVAGGALMLIPWYGIGRLQWVLAVMLLSPVGCLVALVGFLVAPEGLVAPVGFLAALVGCLVWMVPPSPVCGAGR